MRLVVDTNVLVSGFLWVGKPRQLLDLAAGGKIVFCTSAPDSRRTEERPLAP